MLRLAVIATVLALFGGAGAYAQTDDVRAVAFRDDCATSLSDLNATTERLKKAGWVKIDPASHSELKAIYDISMQAAGGLQGMTLDAYSRTIGKSRLHVMISGNVPAQAGKANGCYLYDFDDDVFAPDPDIGGVVERWLGEPPSESTNQRGLISQKKWVGPAALPQMASVRVVSIPSGSPVANTNFFSGLAWAATALAK